MRTRKTMLFLGIFIVGLFLAGCETCMCPDCVCAACEEAEECQASSACPAAETVTKYVCSDGVIVDNSQACIKAPTQTLSDTSSIDSVAIIPAQGTAGWETVLEPACVLGKNGGRIHYETIQLPQKVVVEAKEFGGTYSDVYSFKGLYTAEKSFLVCEGGSCYGGDFVLNAGKVHIVKLRYEMTEENLYSTEFVVDLRSGSEYIAKVCSK